MGQVIKFPVKKITELAVKVEVMCLEDGSFWMRSLNIWNQKAYQWIKLEDI